MKEKKEDLIYGPDSCDVNSLLWLISCFKFDKSSKLELECTTTTKPLPKFVSNNAKYYFGARENKKQLNTLLTGLSCPSQLRD